MRKTHTVRLLLLLLLLSVALTGCARETAAEAVELVLDLSEMPAMYGGDALDISSVSVRLTYEDGRYTDVTDACLFYVDDVAYGGEPLGAGRHLLTVRYALADGRYDSVSEPFTVQKQTPTEPDTPEPEPHIHSFGPWQAAVAPTCSAEGILAHQDCTVCKRHFDEDGNLLEDLTVPIDATAHRFGAWEEVRPATCTQEGEQRRVCALNPAHSESRQTARVAHAFGSWIEEIHATVLSDGVLGHYVCGGCQGNFDGEGRPLDSLVIARTIPTYEDVIRDLSASVYDMHAGDLADAERHLVVRAVTGGDYRGMAEIQTQPVRDGSGIYTLTLPRVDYRTCVAVRLTFRTNNARGISLENGNYVPVEGTTLTMLCDGVKILATLTSSEGTVLQTVEWRDADVMSGAHGATLYVRGIQYTSVYVSPMTGMDTSPAEPEKQSLSLGAALARGIARYSIVYDLADADMALVAGDLADILYRITGLTYHVFGTHSATVVTENSHYIVLGGRLAAGKGLRNFDLTQSGGFNLCQSSTNLYVYSPTVYGTIRGVYGFLKEFADAEFYTADVYTYDAACTLTVPAGYSFARNYDFNYSVAGTAEAAYNQLYAYRLGMLPDWLAFSGAGTDVSSNVHNYLDILPYERYGADHPSWYTYYADAGTYVIHLNADDETMVAIVVEALKAVLAAKPAQEIFVFGQADTQLGPDVGDYLAFINAVTGKINDYLAATAPERQVIIAMLAYNGTFVPPMTGSFFRGSNAKSAVLFAPVGGRHNSAYSDADNRQKNTSTGAFDTETIAQRLTEWASLPGATVLCWFYGTDYFNYLMPFDTLTAMQANVRLARAAGNEMLFYQLQTFASSTVGSDWQRLKLYLASKLAEDADTDVGQLTEDFCKAYFGVAADVMRQLLETERTNLYRNRNASGNGDWYGLVNGSALLLNANCFTLSDLGGYMRSIDAAKALVNAAVTAGELTDGQGGKLLRRIDIESLTFRYLLIAVHGNTKYDESMEAFRAFSRGLGVVAFGETVANQ